MTTSRTTRLLGGGDDLAAAAGERRRRRNPAQRRFAAASALALCGTFLLYGANETLTRDYAAAGAARSRGLKSRRAKTEAAQASSSSRGRRRAVGDGVDLDGEGGGDYRRPNILFFVLDQWRYDWDGRDDHVAPRGAVPLDLPFLSSAAANGTRFTKAYVPAPLCAPSRACLASGKEYDFAGMPTNHADEYPTNQTTYYRLLRDVGGYHVMSCGKDDLFKNDVKFPFYSDPEHPEAGNPGHDRALFEERYPDEWGHGDDDEWSWEPPDSGGGEGERELNPINPSWGTMDIGFSDAIRSAGKTKAIRQIEPFEPYRIFLEETQVPLANGTSVKAFDAYKDCFYSLGPKCDASSFTSNIYPDDFVAQSAKTLLSRKPSDRPWYLQVNFPGPHPPILATSAMADAVKGRSWPQPVDAREEDVCPQDTDGFSVPRNGGRCNYGAQIENLDAIMSSIASHISPEDVDDTLICVSSDHGEMLGDHGQWGKTKPWTASVSVPLVCFGPGVTAGAEHGLPVATLDLPGTFLDYAGVTELPDGMTTRSLRALLEAPEVEEGEAEAAAEAVSKAVSRIEGDRGKTAAAAFSTGYRTFVSSGLADWRIVVKNFGRGTHKLVCCRGECDGNPTSAVPLVEGEWHMLLFDVDNDPFDTTSLHEERPGVVEEMRALLPEGWCPKA